MDAAEFISPGVERTPGRRRRQRDRRSRKPIGQRRNQRVLFYPPLELPDAETNEDRDHGERKEAEAEPRPSCGCAHFGS
jgi:hypothetical protein